jgi:hypothetical protein
MFWIRFQHGEKPNLFFTVQKQDEKEVFGYLHDHLNAEDNEYFVEGIYWLDTDQLKFFRLKWVVNGYHPYLVVDEEQLEEDKKERPVAAGL